jgi:hypothetical protein
MKTLERREIPLKELLGGKRLSFQNLEELERWIKENVVEKGKREIVKNPSQAFRESVIVITDRRKPEGVFINLKDASKLPPEIQAFLFMVLNALGCKYQLRG